MEMLCQRNHINYLGHSTMFKFVIYEDTHITDLGTFESIICELGDTDV